MACRRWRPAPSRRSVASRRTEARAQFLPAAVAMGPGRVRYFARPRDLMGTAFRAQPQMHFPGLSFMRASGALVALFITWAILAPGQIQAADAGMAAQCAQAGNDDTIRHYDPSLQAGLTRAYARLFPGAPMPPPGARTAKRSQHIRCMNGRLLACFTGANLPCGKMDIARDNGADEYCRTNPRAPISCRPSPPATTRSIPIVASPGARRSRHDIPAGRERFRRHVMGAGRLKLVHCGVARPSSARPAPRLGQHRIVPGIQFIPAAPSASPPPASGARPAD